MFKKASVTLVDGFTMGVAGWVVVVNVTDGLLNGVIKTGGMQFDNRKDARKCYTLIKNLIGAME